MATSVKHPSTTPQVGGSGRFLDMAAAGPAVVIAVGVGFAVNQGNDATVSGVDARLDEPAFQAESQRLAGLADHVARNDPENYPTELKRLLAMIETVNAESHPAFNIEKYRLEQTGAAPSPGANIEKYRLEQAAGQGNPLEGIAE